MKTCAQTFSKVKMASKARMNEKCSIARTFNLVIIK